ncbi:hypothetical protein ABIA32_002293 [Streptacidiphilus sp. MAP12-20]|uniref:hypothetical protein n=1 Tax=Streptacidiphilus sp. MAP12-20 TaxID=3156299 RepID=UPI0035198328
MFALVLLAGVGSIVAVFGILFGLLMLAAGLRPNVRGLFRRRAKWETNVGRDDAMQLAFFEHPHDHGLHDHGVHGHHTFDHGGFHQHGV